MKFITCGVAVSTVLFYSKISIAGSPPPFPIHREDGVCKKETKQGAVSTQNTVCSEIGIDIIEQGGNAADATIAMEFCVGVISMASTGLGGGGFALIRTSHGSYENIDFRETAPAAAFQDMFNADDNDSLVGGLASGIPGDLRGLEYLFKTCATWSWKKLIAPSIHVARTGFEVTADLTVIFEGLDSTDFLTNDPAWSVDFAPNGTLVGLGDFMTRKRYAALWKRLQRKGRMHFTVAKAAEQMIAAWRAANGTMTLEDLKDYKIAFRPPLTIQYRDFKITSCGAPSSGSIVLNVMKTIEGYNTIGETATLNISTHRLDEAIRFGFAARRELGDPSFFSNITTYEENIITEKFTSIVRSKILDNTTQPVAAYNPLLIENAETHGTSHIVAADASGMVISLTSTINLWFGSLVIVPETGVIMNNEMNDFSVPGFSNSFGFIPSPINYVAPGKRPQSSMSPTIVEFFANNTFYCSLGGAGGSYIITAIIQCLWNILDRNMSIADSMSEPRFHDQLLPNNIEFEYIYNNETTNFMASLGHNNTWANRGSGVQALRRLPNGTFEAAGEPTSFDSAGLAA